MLVRIYVKTERISIVTINYQNQEHTLKTRKCIIKKNKVTERIVILL